MGNDAPDESADVAKEELPITTTLDLENGIFNLVVSLTHEYINGGMLKEHASARVASLLERYSKALRGILEEEDKETE